MAKETQRGSQKATGLTKSAASALATGRKSGGGSPRRSAAARGGAGRVLRDSPAAARKPSPRGSASSGGSVTMQARVDADFARELVEADAPVLGLDGTSALVREGLRLVHKRARELAMAEEYDEFYGETPAPLPEGVAALWGE